MKKTNILAILILAVLSLSSCTAEVKDPITSYTLLSDKTQIKADGHDAVTFTVKENEKAITGEITIIEVNTGTKLPGLTFTTEKDGEYTFKAIVNGKEIQNQITIEAEKAEAPPDPEKPTEPEAIPNPGEQTEPEAKPNPEEPTEPETGTPEIKVNELRIDSDRTYFTADGKDEFIIKVYGDGVLLDETSGYKVHYTFNEGPYYNAQDSNFKTVNEGWYYFHVMLGDVKSNVLPVFAISSPETENKGELKLTANRDSIDSNGIESASFHVFHEGRDVTDASSILLDTWPYDQELSCTSFSSDRSGIYAFYAEYEGVRSPVIYVNAKDKSLKGSTTVFAEGVTKESGWHDVNKKRDGMTGNDAVLCWAATTANMLEWYQERWVEKGLTLPEDAISGKGDQYELKLFEMFQDEWIHPAGSQAEYALSWYMKGQIEGQVAEGNAKPKDEFSGGYFLSSWDEVRKHTGENFVSVHERYHSDGWSPDVTDNPMLAFSRIVRDSIENGVAGLRIMVPNIHAITLWGYEMDEDGIVRAIYVTDSDNQLARPNEPRKEILQRYELQYNGSDVSFRAYGVNCNIVAITSLEGVH